MEAIRTEYKIRNKRTDLFSTGGAVPHWNKRGKTWRSLRALNQHLALTCRSGHYGTGYGATGIVWGDLEVLCYELKIVPDKCMPLADLASELAARKAEREVKGKLAAKRGRLHRLEEEASQLKKELGIVP